MESPVAFFITTLYGKSVVSVPSFKMCFTSKNYLMYPRKCFEAWDDHRFTELQSLPRGHNAHGLSKAGHVSRCLFCKEMVACFPSMLDFVISDRWCLISPNLSFLPFFLWVQVTLLLAQFLGDFYFSLLNTRPLHLKLLFIFMPQAILSYNCLQCMECYHFIGYPQTLILICSPALINTSL